jgi:undecaprenyl-diphosphatase
VGAVDRQAFYSINRWSDSLYPIMDFFSSATSLLWIKIVLATLVVAMIARGPRCRTAILVALFAVALANELTDLFKALVPMHRPFQELPLSLLGHYPPNPEKYTSMGTASAHSANMAAVAMATTYYLRGWGIPWIVVALLTGLSRIYLGVHYPSQVLFGWTSGIAMAFLVIKTWELILTRRKSVVTGNDEAGDGEQRP